MCTEEEAEEGFIPGARILYRINPQDPTVGRRIFLKRRIPGTSEIVLYAINTTQDLKY